MRFPWGVQKLTRDQCDESQPSCLNCKKKGFQCDLLRGSRSLRKGPEREIPMKDMSQQCDLFPEMPTTETFVSTGVASEQPSFEPEHPSRTYFLPAGAMSESPLPINAFLCSAPLSTSTHLHPSPSSFWEHDEYESLAPSPASTIPSNVELILRRSVAERELIQHFEISTSKVLCFSRTIWDSHVLNSALHNDFLMSSVMLMAAAHINHYLPTNDPQRRPVLHHFGNAISGLRNVVAQELTPRSFDIIMSCSILLILYSWAYIEVRFENTLEVADLFQDTLTLFYSLKDCVVSGKILLEKSRWHEVFSYSPRVALEDYVRTHRTKGDDFYQRINHSTLCGLGTYDPECSSPDNLNSMSRLSLVLCAVRIAASDLEGSGVADDIYRYLLTWPPFCTKGFVQQVKENNPTSLCILLYYYAAIVGIQSEKIWWMRDRALFMYTMLREKLEGRCDNCLGPAILLSGGIERERYIQIAQRRLESLESWVK